MFTCNNIHLLTFTYYLKCILAINMSIIPFLYFYINYILITRFKKVDKLYLKRIIKPTIYILIFILFSFITHNMLNNNSNVCYKKANSTVYYEYKNSYNFLKNKNIDNKLKNDFLNNILINKQDLKLESLVYKKELIENSNNETNNQSSKSEYLHESNLTIQNNVYIIDGIFYYPSYVYGNYSTYSGTACPNDPINEGYNNPYGYNNYFYSRLSYFIEEASKNGFKITISTQGCRNYNTQNYYYQTMERGRAASPGRSLHGFGIASDLEFYKADGSVCQGYRNDYNCPSMGWAHLNANKYGLAFPLLNAGYKEDWHIEPINKNTY